MFAKRAKQSSRQPPTDDGQTAQSGPDPRDAAIERLERELGEQRALAISLRQSLDAATFKSEILEKSYAKQLADTREQLATSERALEDKLKVLGALDGGHEDALRALGDARAELKLLTAERDELRKRAAQGSRQRSEQPTRASFDSAARDVTETGGTINQLISSAAWTDKKKSESASGHATAQVAGHEGPHEEMLSPELVFTGKDAGQDDER